MEEEGREGRKGEEGRKEFDLCPGKKRKLGAHGRYNCEISSSSE